MAEGILKTSGAAMIANMVRRCARPVPHSACSVMPSNGTVWRHLAGHSHYRNTRHRKAAVDKRKQSAQHKLSRDLESALNAAAASMVPTPTVPSSSTPTTKASTTPTTTTTTTARDDALLRDARVVRALEAARRGNLPRARVDAAIARAAAGTQSQGGAPMGGAEEGVRYEVHLPGGVAVSALVRGSPSGVTAKVRAAAARAGGRLAERREWAFRRMTWATARIVVRRKNEGAASGEAKEGEVERAALAGIEAGALEVEGVGGEGGGEYGDLKDGRVHEVRFAVRDAHVARAVGAAVRAACGEGAVVEFAVESETVAGRTVQAVGEEGREKLRGLVRVLEGTGGVIEVAHNVRDEDDD